MPFTDALARAVAAAPMADLDRIARLIWQGHASGYLGDDAAQRLAEALEARKAARRAQPSATTFNALRSPAARRQRSPDRQRSIERRRRLAASGPLPPALAARFTTGELAVMRIIADEVKARGCCALHLDAIAARAGTCRTTAKNAIRRARVLGLVLFTERRRAGQLSLTNIIRIISPEWLAWLRLARKGIAGKNSTTTTIKQVAGEESSQESSQAICYTGQARGRVLQTRRHLLTVDASPRAPSLSGAR